MAPCLEGTPSSPPIEKSLCTDAESHQPKKNYQLQIVWTNVFVFFALHVAAFYGFKLLLFDAKWASLFWAWLLYYIGGTAITAGAHRLWCHRSYSAKFSLRAYLIFANASAFQNDIFEWCRDHRTHHRFTETDADPHNAKRGFFFAHMGWLMCKKHPDVIEKGKTVDMSDLLADPVIVFQRKYYFPLVLLMCFYFPTAVAHYGWGETWWNAFFVCSVFRYVAILHSTWFVNSAAHLWGDKPYDKDINPAESMIAIISSGGEGFHNYHHTFPWDYSTSEWGRRLNISTTVIDIWAWFGLVYNRKTASRSVIERRRLVKGDGSRVWYPKRMDKNKK